MKGAYDFFELTRIGKQTIEKCSRKPDCITTAQHDSCSGEKIYQSASDQVCFDDFYTLNVSNFISKAIGNPCLEPKLSHSQKELEEFLKNLLNKTFGRNLPILPHILGFIKFFHLFLRDDYMKICISKRRIIDNIH